MLNQNKIIFNSATILDIKSLLIKFDHYGFKEYIKQTQLIRGNTDNVVGEIQSDVQDTQSYLVTRLLRSSIATLWFHTSYLAQICIMIQLHAFIYSSIYGHLILLHKAGYKILGKLPNHNTYQ